MQVGDPTFFGYCVEQGAELGNKVVWKAAPGVHLAPDAEFCFPPISDALEG